MKYQRTKKKNLFDNQFKNPPRQFLNSSKKEGEWSGREDRDALNYERAG